MEEIKISDCDYLFLRGLAKVEKLGAEPNEADIANVVSNIIDFFVKVNGRDANRD